MIHGGPTTCLVLVCMIGKGTALSGFDISDEIVQAGLKSPEVKR